jgi:two-component system OmpR family response regulator
VRILVVEDDAKLRALLARGLAEEGYAVDVAGNGIDAVWQATEHSFDGVVLDLGLPDLDGFTVCRRLREHGTWAPVLMLTALDAVDERVRGLDVGADDYLVKPFAFAELLARLRALQRRGVPSRSPRTRKNSFGACSLSMARCWLSAGERSR